MKSLRAYASQLARVLTKLLVNKPRVRGPPLCVSVSRVGENLWGKKIFAKISGEKSQPPPDTVQFRVAQLVQAHISSLIRDISILQMVLCYFNRTS